MSCNSIILLCLLPAKYVQNASVTLLGVHIWVFLLRGTQSYFACYNSVRKLKQFNVQIAHPNFPNRNNSTIFTLISSKPTTRKQKKARKTRGLELLSDIEDLDIMLGGRHSEIEENVSSNLARRPESTNSNLFENN